MQTYLDCYPCFLRQALSIARRSSATEAQQHQILLTTMQQLEALPPGAKPPQMAQTMHHQVRQLVGVRDPFRQAKEQATQEALALLPRLQTLVSQSSKPLETALRIAIAGNIIDLGVADSYDLEATLARVLQQPFAIDDLSGFRKALIKTDSILYLADNAGETVFDRVLIETLDLPVTYVVKGGPIINDATREDAIAAGIDQVAQIIDNGSDAPGTLLEQCSETFLHQFKQARLIIAKGQGNYESLSGVEAPVFFLLQAKCSVIANNLGIDQGDIVLKTQLSPLPFREFTG